MALFLDTETTGLSPRMGASIVEVAIVNEGGHPLINTLVNPLKPIPWQATKVHGITDAMVANQPTLLELMPHIDKVVKGQQIVIYNAAFDVPFFPNALIGAGRIDCAMNFYAKNFGSGRKAKLSDVADKAGYVWKSTAHRALADADACRVVWQWMNKAPVKKTTLACSSCHQLLAVPCGKLLDVTCPKCRYVFRVQT